MQLRAGELADVAEVNHIGIDLNGSTNSSLIVLDCNVSDNSEAKWYFATVNGYKVSKGCKNYTHNVYYEALEAAGKYKGARSGKKGCKGSGVNLTRHWYDAKCWILLEQVLT